MTGTIINTAPLHALVHAALLAIPAVLFAAVLATAHAAKRPPDRGGFGP
jgi:hypothetical protein